MRDCAGMMLGFRTCEDCTIFFSLLLLEYTCVEFTIDTVQHLQEPLKLARPDVQCLSPISHDQTFGFASHPFNCRLLISKCLKIRRVNNYQVISLGLPSLSDLWLLISALLALQNLTQINAISYFSNFKLFIEI